jgi:hypothetical protein
MKQGTYEGSYRLELMEHQRRLLGALASPEEVEDWDLEVVRAQELVDNSLGGCPPRLSDGPSRRLSAFAETLHVG